TGPAPPHATATVLFVVAMAGEHSRSPFDVDAQVRRKTKPAACQSHSIAEKPVVSTVECSRGCKSEIPAHRRYATIRKPSCYAFFHQTTEFHQLIRADRRA